ncbi:hypothetical protein BDW72DRAFT_195893 [Aspergillus terricola var. indicus]
MYSLERRAIFSRKWMLVSHQLRFTEPGSYLQLQEGGFSFFLILDRQGKIHGFHNVSRHRAYPLMEEDAGTVKILACKYHGWSENGLFPIHVHIDKLGFIWVNFDAAETPTVRWEDDFAEQPRLKLFVFSQYWFDHAWDMIGGYNWKTLADNYNECYHCPTGHPGIVQYTDLGKYWVETKAGHIQHYNTDRSDHGGMGIISTFYFPNACMTVSPHFFYLMRCVPITASQTHMPYEVYRHKNASDEDFHKIDSIFKQLLKEDKDRCNAAQRNLNTGVYINGELHPEHEKGPLFFQQSVKDLVVSHHRAEESRGGEIWPATPVPSMPSKLDEDMELCRKDRLSGW